MKGLALIIGPKSGAKAKGASPSPSLPSPYKSEEPDEDDAPEAKGPEDGYGTVLARIAGVADEDRDDFVSALKGFVRSCVRKEKDGDY